MCDLSKTATAPSLRSYMLTQGNDMVSTFPVKRSPPRDGQLYSSLTAGEKCLDHCDCSIPNTVLLTVGSNQCHISDQQISCVPDQPAIACVRSASQQTHLGCIFHPRTESEKATRGLQQRRTEDGVEDGTRHRTDSPPTWNQMALDRLVSNASIPLLPGLSPALRAGRPNRLFVHQPKHQVVCHCKVDHVCMCYCATLVVRIFGASKHPEAEDQGLRTQTLWSLGSEVLPSRLITTTEAASVIDPGQDSANELEKYQNPSCVPLV
jgi:hypothetical protein